MYGPILTINMVFIYAGLEGIRIISFTILKHFSDVGTFWLLLDLARFEPTF